ncbi:hypothetical protein D3C73_583040 [compost metagenome]
MLLVLARLAVQLLEQALGLGAVHRSSEVIAAAVEHLLHHRTGQIGILPPEQAHPFIFARLQCLVAAVEQLATRNG